MGRRAHAQRLNIWLNGTPVGHWDSSSGQSTLTYFDEWLSDEDARPLSLSLPFQPNNEAHRGLLVRNYFDNLLPDSEAIRSRIAQRFKLDSIDPHQLLTAVGRDCVGAIQLLPPNERPEDLFSIQGEPLDERKVAAELRGATSDRPLGQRDEHVDLRLSIAGAQEKTALLWHKERWHRPEGSTPTTHIFKLPLGLVGAMQADMRTSVENEWLCSIIIREFGLPIANCEISRFDDVKALVVERFDRRFSQDGTWIVRLPQEDFCQATGKSPHQKYQSDGGPGIKEIMAILLGSENADVDRLNFFKTQLIFWLLAATDGHAKNFSIFNRPRSSFTATPLYDVLSAHPIIGRGANQISHQEAKLAMAIRSSQNHYLIQQIQRRHWLAQAKTVGLGTAAAERLIEEVLRQAKEVAALAYGHLPEGFPMDLADSVINGMLEQCGRLERM